MKSLFKILFVLFPFYSVAQTKMYNTMIKDSTQKILYLSLENILKVEGKNLKDNECSISIDKGKIVAIGNSRYQIKPETLGITVVKFYRKGKLVLTENFDVQRIPSNYTNKYNNSSTGND